MFNKEILQILDNYGIKQNEALTVLLIIYYNLEKDNQIMVDEYISVLSKCKIISYNFRKQQYDFLIPLFFEYENEENDWIKDYMDMFAKINPERRGDKKACKKNIAKLMKDFHFVTPQLILDATKIYLKKISGPKYLKKSHKFIWDEENGYEIMTYINILRDNKEIQDDKITDIL